ncbi:MAG: restriction endonuclease [Leptospirillum sp.]
MAMPEYQSFMRPILEIASDGKEHSIPECLEPLSVKFHLSMEDQKVLLPSGKQTIFKNRVAWAKHYLNRAGLLESPRRGFFRITSRGQDALISVEKIDKNFLLRYKEFADFIENGTRRRIEETDPPINLLGASDQKSPEESVETAFRKFRQELEAEILQTLKTCSSDLFEKIVVDVLVRMGYGGNRKDAGESIGGTGDGGIDGIIKEDRLGLDTIYIQAKKWEGSVGRPEVHKFAGALQGKHAKKGVLITTSSFTRDAREYVSHLENKIVLIDGAQLVDLMIDFNVGVSPLGIYETKKIDLDYFEE